ncbi:MAG: TldD/PmbA family protein [Candidatus Krumholzibacteriota bacterium]|nr:TldD/PmbA family protein [Candidatus Krumholzibacteriota bacterium]
MITDLTRRSFVKGLGLGAAALAVPRWWPGVLAAPAEAALPSAGDVDRILRAALARGGDYADLYLETRVATNIRVAGGEVASMEYGVLQGGGVRTVAGEKTGYAYAESFDPADLERVAASAAGIAGSSRPGRVSPPAEVPLPRIVRAEQPVTGPPVADKLAILDRVDRAARAASPQVTQVVISYYDSAQDTTIVTSDGHRASDSLPVIYLRVEVSAEKGGVTAEGMVRVSGRQGMEILAGDVPERAGREAAEQALRMLDARPAPSGEMPVVVAAGGGVMFHEAVGHGLEADGVLRQASVFAGRVGERVASELVTIHDDATLPGKRGSFNVDDEATTARDTLLIERGVLRGFMQDRRTARLTGAGLTANGRRESFRHPAIVRMTNTNLARGAHDPGEIIRDTRRGIYAVSFGGGEVDTASGQFTFGLREAYLIEDGRLTAPLRGAILVGSGPAVLLGIDRVGTDFDDWPGTCGKDGQWVPVTSGCPTLRIAKLVVGGTA